MGKVADQKQKDKAQTVVDLLKKQSPLTLKQQEKFCNKACVERFLKAKNDSVKKAVKQLRNCLAWRDSIGTEHLIADEFCSELVEGLAYVAGHDEESRPVMIFRIKQEYQKFHSQKQFTRLLVFTLEVAIHTMSKNVEQFVLLLDASFFRSASAFMNMLLSTLKIIGDYYPGRLHKAFIIDPPSLFSYLWKGVKPFVELSPLTMVVSSLDFEEALELNDFVSYPRVASLRFDPSNAAKVGSCSSSRFSFTVSHHNDSVLKPWHLSLTNTNTTSGSKVGPTAMLGPAISPLNARSHSFASPSTRGGNAYTIKRGFFPSTPLPQKTQKLDSSAINHPRTPGPSFLPSSSSSLFFSKDNQVNKATKCRQVFVPYLKFYRRPYDEMIYRSKMRPPLGGLISIISPQLKRRHMSVSQRF